MLLEGRMRIRNVDAEREKRERERDRQTDRQTEGNGKKEIARAV